MHIMKQNLDKIDWYYLLKEYAGEYIWSCLTARIDLRSLTEDEDGHTTLQRLAMEQNMKVLEFI